VSTVGQDTLYEGDLPPEVANYSSLSAFAAKTAEDWTSELSEAEETRWGDGFLGGLFAGLAQGKPFITALFEALLQEAFEDLEETFENVEDTFVAVASNFNGKWRDLIAAKDAADYANSQLAVSNRPIVELFDGSAGDLPAVWDVSYFDSVGGLAGGEVQQDGNGNGWWDGFGTAAKTGRCVYVDTATATDDQIVTVVMPLRVQAPALLTGQSHLRVLLRCNADGDEYVFATITDNSVRLGYRVGGSVTHFAAAVGTSTQNGDVWNIYVSGSTLYAKRNGIVVDSRDCSAAEVDSDHRFVGFEMFANSRGLFGQTSPGTIAVFSADDY
jgi:hypothetical protein